MNRVVDTTRVCRVCNEEHPIEEFWSSKKTQRVSRRICRECRNTRWRGYWPTYYKKHRTKLLDYRRQLEFGITPEEYTARLKEQRGVCALCKGVNPDGKQLAVDHDHHTDVIRKLLCHGCNVGLGHFKDNPELLVAASDYVKSFR